MLDSTVPDGEKKEKTHQRCAFEGEEAAISLQKKIWVGGAYLVC